MREKQEKKRYKKCLANLTFLSHGDEVSRTTLATDVIAQKYAKALLNLYFETLSKKCFASVLRLEQFFKKKQSRRLFHYLCIPTLSQEMKEVVLSQVFEVQKTCPTIKRLVRPLLQHRRIEILDKVLSHIITQYRNRKNISLVLITTSHQMTEIQEKKVVTALEKKIGRGVVSRFEVDKNLIVGMKIQGDFFLWEQSITKQLRDVKLSIIQRVGL